MPRAPTRDRAWRCEARVVPDAKQRPADCPPGAVRELQMPLTTREGGIPLLRCGRETCRDRYIAGQDLLQLVRPVSVELAVARAVRTNASGQQLLGKDRVGRRGLDL